VLPALDTILATVAVMAGERSLPSHASRRHQVGRAAMAREQTRICGPDPP